MIQADMHGTPVAVLVTKVEYTACKLARKLRLHTMVDDLISAGNEGLMDAARKFQKERRINFWTYAEHRVRGAMLDWLRQQDMLPRDTRAVRDYKQVRQCLAHELGREPESWEIALKLGVSVTRCEALYRDANAVRLISLDTLLLKMDGQGIPDQQAADAYEAASETEVCELVAAAITTLHERLRFVVVEYYYKDRTLREIGNELGVIESRACQLLAEARAKLRPLVGNLVEEPFPEPVH